MDYYNEREAWHNAYIHELVELYGIFRLAMTRHGNAKEEDIDDELMFHHFSRMVFNDSSGFISEYTKANIESSVDF
jgi:hypothetical protein